LDSNCTGGKVCKNNACVSNTTSPDPAKTAADTAISSAQSAISSAKGQGKNVTNSEVLLSQANSKYNSGDYSWAKTLAEQARQSALDANTSQGTGTGGTESTGTTDSGSGPGISGLALVCVGGLGLFFLAIIGIFLIIALLAMFYKRK
jgi:hypothetical protein